MIAVLPGDGIGPEVVAEGLRVLRAVADVEVREGWIGGSAIDRTGDPLPRETVDLCRQSRAVLLGAVGGPRWEAGRPEQGLLAIRKALGLYANLRPFRSHPRIATPLRPEIVEGADLVIVRELTGGIYFGEKRREGDRAVDTCVYTVAEVERIAEIAASLARARKRRLVSVDKANVLETSRLWRETVARVVGDRYPDVRLEHLLVDSAAMRLVSRPRDFDVVVTENMFGDILTDEASVLMGSMGMPPSASLGAKPPYLYEPVHGSAPDIAGKGLANPYATILSVALLLRFSLGDESSAARVERAVWDAVERGVFTRDLGGAATTRQAADAVLAGL